MIYYPIKYISNLLINSVVAFLNIFIRRDKDIVLIGAWMGEKFTDNSRYLYQYLHYNKQSLKLNRVIWVTRNKALLAELQSKNYECYKMNSLKSLYFHLKSGVHIVCNVPHSTKKYKGDILGELSLGAKRIQLWHGIPLKGVGNTISTNSAIQATSNPIRKLSKSLKKFYLFKHLIHVSGGWDDFRLLSTSKDVSKRFERIFDISPNKIIDSSYPRNCECLEYLQKEQEVLDRISSAEFTVLYLPTFREGNIKFAYPLDTEEINKLIDKHSILWIEKPHSADNNFGKRSNNLSKCTLLLESEFDINTIVPKVDLIITDYSSVSFDAIYYNKKVIYYIPDFDNYISNERGLSSGFDENTAGFMAKSIEKLSESILYDYFNRKNSDDEEMKLQSVKELVFDSKKAAYNQIIHDLELEDRKNN
ncbi:CDP-glycerol glycerophosphotransferase family protein [Enterococcus sp. LJL51]|uniref:CDP-glycerol glycerophosphotransferase family protein n=1 Tax=Enterococcus sp. LJL51 TaxID=3416656 RepID=UPI003CF66FAA